MVLTWDVVFGIAVASSLMTPLVIYQDWRSKGKKLTEADYWKTWFGTGAILSILLGCMAAWWIDLATALDCIGAVVLGMIATFWYAWIIERCLCILGAIAPSR